MSKKKKITAEEMLTFFREEYAKAKEENGGLLDSKQFFNLLDECFEEKGLDPESEDRGLFDHIHRTCSREGRLVPKGTRGGRDTPYRPASRPRVQKKGGSRNRFKGGGV